MRLDGIPGNRDFRWVAKVSNMFRAALNIIWPRDAILTASNTT